MSPSRDIIYPMHILLTSARSNTGRIVSEQLAGHNLRRTDMSADDDIIQCDLGHGAETDDIVAGVDAIVHIGYGGFTSDDPNAVIDYHTRRTYNLLWAASEAGVPLVINISTLRLMAAYEENLVVTESWKPLPHAGDVDLLAAHLCEIQCKEFARDRKIKALNLRIGWPFTDGPKQAAVALGSDSAVCANDIGLAINAALAHPELPQWADLHIQSTVPNQRYTTAKATQMLGISL